MARFALTRSLAAVALATGLAASIVQIDAPLAAAKTGDSHGHPMAPAHAASVNPHQLAKIPPTGDTPIQMQAPRNYPVSQDRYRQLKQQVDADADQRDQRQSNNGGGAVLEATPGAQFATLNSSTTGGWNPPDGALAVRPTSLVSGANEGLAIYNRGGALLHGPWSFESFFKDNATSV